MSRNESRTSLVLISKIEITGLKGQKDKSISKDKAPLKYTNMLMSSSSLKLDVEVVKKLRLLLRNEPAR